VIGFDQAPRYAELIRRVFGEDADLTPPGMILESDPDEFALWAQKKWWATRASVNAGGAGFRSSIEVFNPIPPRPQDPTFISVVKGFIPQPQVGGTFETDLLQKTVTQLTTLVGQVFLTDMRSGGIAAAGSGATQLRTQNNAAAVTADTFAALVVDRSLPYFPLHVVLGAGHGLLLIANADNLGVAGGFFGYERPARAEEQKLA
jgi:hypothetical protein